MSQRLHIFHMGSGNCMGHVSGLEKYECVIWKVCMDLSRFDDGNV